MFATDVFLFCSYGVGGCGAAGDFDDLTRPQDLQFARAYVSCLHHGPNGPTENEARLRASCATSAGISFGTAGSYAGPWVFIKNGKPWHMHAGVTVANGPAPHPAASASSATRIRDWFMAQRIARCFPFIAHSVFLTHESAAFDNDLPLIPLGLALSKPAQVNPLATALAAPPSTLVDVYRWDDPRSRQGAVETQMVRDGDLLAFRR